MTAEEARCGVAAALIGSQGAEMRVSSAEDRVTGRCRQSEVSAERRGNIFRLKVIFYIILKHILNI